MGSVTKLGSDSGSRLYPVRLHFFGPKNLARKVPPMRIPKRICDFDGFCDKIWVRKDRKSHPGMSLPVVSRLRFCLTLFFTAPWPCSTPLFGSEKLESCRPGMNPGSSFRDPRFARNTCILRCVGLKSPLTKPESGKLPTPTLFHARLRFWGAPSIPEPQSL